MTTPAPPQPPPPGPHTTHRLRGAADRRRSASAHRLLALSVPQPRPYPLVSSPRRHWVHESPAPRPSAPARSAGHAAPHATRPLPNGHLPIVIACFLPNHRPRPATRTKDSLRNTSAFGLGQSDLDEYRPSTAPRIGFRVCAALTGDAIRTIDGAIRAWIAPSPNLTARRSGTAPHRSRPRDAERGHIPRFSGQFSSPVERIALSTLSFVACVGSTSGSRTSGEHLPSTFAAYFTGAGLVSAKSASCSGIMRC